MEDMPNIHTEDEIEQQETVVQESNTTGLDLAMQVFPLLDEYFCGAFVTNTKGVLMKLENGQLFQLTITEVA